MQRIERITEADAPAKTRDLLSAVKTKMGMIPNIVATMAQSPAALGGYLNFSGALSEGVLSPALSEQIALTVAGANACDYCASAHTVVGGMEGVDADELTRNLRGESADAKTAAALKFVSRVIDLRGNVSDIDLAGVRAAGFSDEETVELIAHTALNIFTNYFNHIAETEIDFPHVDTRKAAAA